MNPLAVVPTYVTDARDLALLADCLETMRDTAGWGLDIIVVDDGSPAQELLDGLERDFEILNFDLHRKEENSGFAATVNVGLKLALETDRDAILVNADIEFEGTTWLANMLGQRKLHGEGLADVVGALLLYPNGTIQHAGVYFSLLSRCFDHLHKFGPGNLPEALTPRACPVTAALQLIRHETLCEVGLYDEDFKMGWEDVDYCLRTFLAGRECVYTPTVRAYHHESVFRGRQSDKLRDWQIQSITHLATKYADTNFATLVPSL